MFEHPSCRVTDVGALARPYRERADSATTNWMVIRLTIPSCNERLGAVAIGSTARTSAGSLWYSG
jgi:hypothetical protein